MDGKEFLKSSKYPGRGLIIGKKYDGQSTEVSVVYFIMGRSPSSKARVLKNDCGLIIWLVKYSFGGTFS